MVAVEVADALTCIEFVQAGFGMAFVPTSHRVHAQGIRARTVEYVPTWGVAPVLPDNRALTAAARALADLTITRSDQLTQLRRSPRAR